MDKRLLDILCCPISKQPVDLASSAQLEALNRAVDTGSLRDDEGTPVTRRFEAALVTRDRRSVYRVDDGIPVMLGEQAVGTTQIEGFPG